MEIILGTVQFGLSYGITNSVGKTPFKEVQSIMEYAKKVEIKTLDTAPSYGDAENILGSVGVSNFEIITKTPHFPGNTIRKQDIHLLIQTIKSSLDALKVNQVSAILIHNVMDCYKFGIKDVFDTLRQMKEDGIIKKIGVSVYEVKDIERIVELDFLVDIIQIPINVLNQSVVQKGWLPKLKEKNIEIHARSIFLQGLLLADEEALNIDQREALEEYFHQLRLLNLTKLEGALLYINQIKEIDKVLVGINNLEHLKAIIVAKNRVQVLENKIEFEKFATSNRSIIDPRLW
ncbi:aldo/keto reductase [Lysinibacillus capsici]|uniref:aldo/keto reductase n=1 Tax=Lysinibacillus capsici TaxID=2115968 RepID=UPI0028A6D497|nr:aldo/keto reductase [Lysinibacillus capsici]